jgi:catechol 2,3-dioxygenase-like lactoylglutathione lyase family enzyme
MVKATFRYVGIRVKNLKRSTNFYTRLPGMTAKGRSNPNGIWIELL